MQILPDLPLEFGEVCGMEEEPLEAQACFGNFARYETGRNASNGESIERIERNAA